MKTRADDRRTRLPYGVWTCADGREVIFNRFYTPIWQRLDGVVLAADPAEWVTWTTQRWFYVDGDTRQPADLCRRIEGILAAFQNGEDVRSMVTPMAPTLKRAPRWFAVPRGAA